MDKQFTRSGSLSIMIWNCQRAESRLFYGSLVELRRLYDPTILALMEIKISGSSAKELERRLNFDSNYKVEAQGFRGVIWVLWKSSIMDL